VCILEDVIEKTKTARLERRRVRRPNRVEIKSINIIIYYCVKERSTYTLDTTAVFTETEFTTSAGTDRVDITQVGTAKNIDTL